MTLKTKLCSLCGKEKTLENYWKHKLAKDKLYAHCKTCHLVLSRRCREKNREKYREISRKSAAVWRKKHPILAKRRSEKYRKLYKVRYNQRSREKYLECRKKVITKLGGVCECCGEKDYRFLSIDHRNNDGKKHRSLLNGFYKKMYMNILNNKEEFDLRVLCYNCNFGRQFYGGEGKVCPHTMTRVRD